MRLPKHSLSEAMELWHRLTDKTVDPYNNMAGHKTTCFFCDEQSPNHKSYCIWLKAIELCAADRRGEVIG